MWDMLRIREGGRGAKAQSHLQHRSGFMYLNSDEIYQWSTVNGQVSYLVSWHFCGLKCKRDEATFCHSNATHCCTENFLHQRWSPNAHVRSRRVLTSSVATANRFEVFRTSFNKRGNFVEKTKTNVRQRNKHTIINWCCRALKARSHQLQRKRSSPHHLIQKVKIIVWTLQKYV